MQKYELHKIQIYSRCAYLLYSTSVYSPYDWWEEIQRKHKIEDGVIIVVDQLLQIGNSDKRFVVFKVKGKKLDFRNLRYIMLPEYTKELKPYILNFLRANSEILKYSILFEHEKEQILNGLNI